MNREPLQDQSIDSTLVFTQIYPSLGIISGDIINVVNGIKADSSESLLIQLLSGYSAGKLCVDFERKNILRKSCFQKDHTNSELLEKLRATLKDYNFLKLTKSDEITNARTK